MSGLLVNLGCGATPTPGWVNLDNSPTVRLARYPALVAVLRRAGALGEEQVRFAGVARAAGVRFADVARQIPLGDGAARCLYSSHMLEHLDRAEAAAFLAEALRVLAPGGLLRLAVPDLRKLMRRYEESRDADQFVAATMLTQPRPRGLVPRLRAALLGSRHHLWMYDGDSLVRLLRDCGLRGARALPAGETGLESPGALDLFERADESVYVEARKPA